MKLDELYQVNKPMLVGQIIQFLENNVDVSYQYDELFRSKGIDIHDSLEEIERALYLMDELELKRFHKKLAGMGGY